MRIQHNIMAMSSYRNYTNNVTSMKANLEKLSSGYKINRAGDDAAGLAISEKMRAQITGLKQAQANAKSGINLVQTAEGALQEVQDMLNRMVKLAEQSSNGTYDDTTDRDQLQKEFDKLRDEIDRIHQSANFNGKALFDSTNAAGGAGGGGGGGNATYTAAATQPDGITADVTAATATAGDVKVKIATASADKAATVAGKDDLANLTFTAKADDGSVANGYSFVIKTSGDTSTEGAVIDDSAKTITITLKQDGGTSGTYEAADINTLIENAKDGTGGAYSGALSIGSGELVLSGTGSINATGAAATVGTAKLGGGESSGDKVVTLTSAAGTFTKTFDTTAWTGDVVVDGSAENGVKVTIDTTETGLKTDGTESTLGTVAGGGNNGGGAGGGVSFNFQVGDTNDSYNVITVDIKGISQNDINDKTEGTGATLQSLSIADEDSAGAALKSLKGMVNYISDIRGDLGAVQNRLEHTINNLGVMEENIQDAESTIRDTDVAEEMMAYTKNNILIQSAQAMLAQANQVPQGVLQLLQ